MSLTQDPITDDIRLVAPGRSLRLGPRPSGCPFCPGNEESTPEETGRIATPADVDFADYGEDIHSDWIARSFPNLFPLTDPHEVLVPSPRHVTSWRELTLVELSAGIELLHERRHALKRPGCYLHAFVNDGAEAGASIAHVHAQLISVPAEQHAKRLTYGVRGDACAFCELLVNREDLIIQKGLRYAIVAHPMPRIGGGLLVIPIEHDTTFDDEPPAELAALLHRALQALPEEFAMNMWFVESPEQDAHWYIELQPRTANLAGVELALGLAVVAQDPVDVAVQARERLAMT